MGCENLCAMLMQIAAVHVHFEGWPTLGVGALRDPVRRAALALRIAQRAGSVGKVKLHVGEARSVASCACLASLLAGQACLHLNLIQL